jgi:hypothetical protein
MFLFTDRGFSAMKEDSVQRFSRISMDRFSF